MKIPKLDSISDPILSETIKNILCDANIPGAVVAICHGDETVVVPHGQRKLNTAAPVDNSTVFSIASCSKAFTACSLMMLVEDGQLTLEEKVVNHLPDFQLDTDLNTSAATIRDLLAMRLGLGGLGIVAWGQNRTLPHRTMLSRLKYLPRTAPLGQSYTYLNTAYMALALIVEQCSDKSFSDFLQQRIFQPLDMKDSFLEEGTVADAVNCSVPNVSESDQIVSLGAPQCGGRMGESCLYISGRDAANWLGFHLSSGITRTGQRLLSKQSMEQMYSPQVHGVGVEELNLQSLAYAMGWHACDFGGINILCHEGGEFGASAHTIVCHEANFAVAVYANLPESQVVKGLTFGLLDAFTIKSGRNWQEINSSLKERLLTGERNEMEKKYPLSAEGEGSPVGNYEGSYYSDLSGRLQLKYREGTLNMVIEEGSVYNSSLHPLSDTVLRVIPHFDAMKGRGKIQGRARLLLDENKRVYGIDIGGLGEFHRIM